jgi:hypothetical protein
MAQKMFSGNATRESIAESSKETRSEQDIIKSVLTPEQLEAYDEYQKEDKARMARLVANSELMQMQTTLNLTEEQQDKVFAVLADETINQFDPTLVTTNGFDFRKLAEKKTEALRDILTSDQLERYQKHQEQQLKLIESLVPAFATNRPPR